MSMPHTCRCGTCHAEMIPGFVELGSAWQPIETAPKDGTEVLVWLTGNRTDQFNNRPMVVKHDGYSGWNFPGVGGLRASHWMPAPVTPSKES